MPLYENGKVYAEEDEWIVLTEEEVLWIPSDVRPCVPAIHSSQLALGLQSGRVIFFDSLIE